MPGGRAAERIDAPVGNVLTAICDALGDGIEVRAEALVTAMAAAGRARVKRKHRGLTQDQLAERTGMSKGYISQLEIGTRQYTQELLEAFAAELRCGPADLIMRDPSQPEPIWSLWDNLPDAQKPQAVAVIQALTKTGTNG
jgi:DNA-binding Xre family transcriptional regulator